MSVLEKRNAIGRVIREELGSDFVVAVGPDHPLLLKGPDILVGGSGRITAVYIADNQEASQDSLLRSRYILSCLALPPSTRHVFVHAEEEKKSFSQTTKHFSEELEWNASKELVRIVRDANFRVRDLRLRQEVISLNQVRFSEAYRTVRFSKRLISGMKAKHLERSSRAKIRAKLIDRGPEILGVSENYFSGDFLPANTVKRLISNAIDRSFRLDEGRPVLSDRLNVDLGAVTDVQSLRSDPEKTVRAAAFAGWALLENLPSDRLKPLAERFRARRKTSNQNE